MSKQTEEAKRALPQLDKLKTENNALKPAIANAVSKGEAVEKAIAEQAAELSGLQIEESVYKAIAGAKDVEAVSGIVKGLEGEAAEFAATLSLDGITEVPKYTHEIKAVTLARNEAIAGHATELHDLVGEFNSSIKGLSIEGVSELTLEEATKVASTKAGELSSGVKALAEGATHAEGASKLAKFYTKPLTKDGKEVTKLLSKEGMSSLKMFPAIATVAAVGLGASLLMGRGKDKYPEFDAAQGRA